MAELPTRQQLLDSLKKADAAGDEQAARTFANMIREERYTTPVEVVDVPPSVPQPPPEAGAVHLAEGAQSIGGSLLRGISDLPAMLAGGVVPPDNFGELTSKPSFAGRNKVVEAITEFLPGLIGAEKPATPGGRIADAGIRALAGGAMMPARQGFRAVEALTAGGAGTGGQAMMEGLAERGYGAGAQLVGNILTALGIGGLTSAGRALTPKPVGEILAGKVDDPEALRLAAATAKQARADGFQANPLDAMRDGNRGLRDVQDDLVRTAGAPKVSQNVRQQGGALQTKGNELIQSLPGGVLTPRQLSNQARRTATERLQQIQREASAAFDAELEAVQAPLRAQKAADVGGAVTDLRKAADDLTTAKQVQANVDQGVAPMLAEEAGDIRKQLEAGLAKLKDKERLDLLRAGREVSNEMAFNVDELGNWGTLIMARQALAGGNKRTWTAAELRARGVDDELLGAMMQRRQPTMGFEENPVVGEPGKSVRAGTETSSTGVIDVDGAAQGPPGPTREGQAARSMQRLAADDVRSAEQGVDAAEQALLNVQARYLGKELLPADVKASVDKSLAALARSKRGDEGLTTDIAWLRGQLANVRTAKELHNLILAVKKELPSVKALNNSAADLSETSVLGQAVGKLKFLRNEAAPEYAAADAAYKAHRGIRDATYENSYLGRLASRSGSQIEQDAQEGLIFNLLRKGESPNVKQSELRWTLQELARVDPKSVVDMLPSYLDELLANAFSKQRTALTPEKPGEALTMALGDLRAPANQNNLHALRILVDESAKAAGLPKSKALAMQRGVDQLIDFANMNSRSPRMVRELAPGELRAVAEDPKILSALRLIGVNPGSVVLGPITRRQAQATYAKLDELLSNPDKVEDLIRLGMSQPLTRTQKSLIAAVVGATQTTQPPAEQPE
jgi:hypothetical protein